MAYAMLLLWMNNYIITSDIFTCIYIIKYCNIKKNITLKKKVRILNM